MKAGYLYVAVNKAFPGFVKIGITENINSRISTYQTGDPHRSYRIIYYVLHPKYKIAEKKIKESMKYFSTDSIQKGEWFRIAEHMAISRLTEQVDDYNNDPEHY